jgi:hypothetical protein
MISVLGQAGADTSPAAKLKVGKQSKATQRGRKQSQGAIGKCVNTRLKATQRNSVHKKKVQLIKKSYAFTAQKQTK